MFLGSRRAHSPCIGGNSDLDILIMLCLQLCSSRGCPLQAQRKVSSSVIRLTASAKDLVQWLLHAGFPSLVPVPELQHPANPTALLAAQDKALTQCREAYGVVADIEARAVAAVGLWWMTWLFLILRQLHGMLL